MTIWRVNVDAAIGTMGLVALALATSGCWDSEPRHAVPAELVEQVEVPGYRAIRFWGDVDTEAFEAAMKAQFVALKAAAASGAMQNANDTANILAISGGGDEGAFAAGYLAGWTDTGTRPTFDTVTGVSTGALAAPFAFLGPSRDPELNDIYTQNGAADLYETRWDYGVFGNALHGTAPLKALIESHATDALLDAVAAEYRIGRRLLISTTNLDAQRPVIWDLSAIAASGRPDRRALFVDLLLASSAVPGIFPPVRIKVTANGRTFEELHADGAVAMQMFFLPPNVHLEDAERQVFGKPRTRSLYVLRNGKLAPEYRTTESQAVALLKRGIDTLVKYQIVYNLRLLQDGATATGTRFRFMGIPGSFDAEPEGHFDKAYAEKLYARAREVGAKGEWLDDVPKSPGLVEAAIEARQATRLAPAATPSPYKERALP